MPTDTRNAESSRRGPIAAGVALVGLLLAITAGLIFQSGAYAPTTWLPLMVAAAALLLVVAIAGPSLTSTRLQKALLLAFVLQAIWTAASLLWASSLNNAWQETNRTTFYVIVVALAFVAVRWSGTAGLKAVAIAVAAAAAAVSVVIIVTLGVSGEPEDLFLQGRLNWPVGYFNALAALLMMGFWITLGLADGSRCVARTEGAAAEDGQTTSRVAWRRSQCAAEERFPRWAQALLLVLALLLAETALLPQSRGALWTFFLVLPFFLILSTHRLRALTDLVLIAIPVVVFWNDLNAPYLALSDGTPLDSAIVTYLTALGYSAAIVLGGWALSWLIERWVGPLRRNAALWVGVAVASVAILGAAAGIVYADIRAGGIDDYLGDQWRTLTSDKNAESLDGTRFSVVGLSGRVVHWEVAADAFLDHPVLGLGAQNFEDYWNLHRPNTGNVRQPHSQPMQLLAELGFPGLLLWLVFSLGVMVRAAVIRFRSSEWGLRVTVAALTAAALSWFIHSSADWLWQIAAVTVPAMMLFGGLLGADKSMGAASNSTARSTSTDADAAVTDATQEVRSPWRARTIRILVALLALGAIASAAFPYLSLRYSASAAGAGDVERAQARADKAAWLDPTSTEPYASLASVHTRAASESQDPTQKLEHLRSAAEAWEEAIELEPASWIYYYLAAKTLIAAKDAAAEAGDFSAVQELALQARTYLEEAKRLNPLASEIDAQERLL